MIGQMRRAGPQWCTVLQIPSTSGAHKPSDTMIQPVRSRSGASRERLPRQARQLVAASPRWSGGSGRSSDMLPSAETEAASGAGTSCIPVCARRTGRAATRQDRRRPEAAREWNWRSRVQAGPQGRTELGRRHHKPRAGSRQRRNGGAPARQSVTRARRPGRRFRSLPYGAPAFMAGAPKMEV